MISWAEKFVDIECNRLQMGEYEDMASRQYLYGFAYGVEGLISPDVIFRSSWTAFHRMGYFDAIGKVVER